MSWADRIVHKLKDEDVIRWYKSLSKEERDYVSCYAAQFVTYMWQKGEIVFTPKGWKAIKEVV